LDLTGAYGVLANGGRAVVPTAILCIRDARGQIVEQLADGCSERVLSDAAAAPRAPLQERVLDEGLAYLMTSILSDSEARIPGFGAARSTLELAGRPAAAKTGTTEDTRDALTVGYTPQLVVGVWVGNSDGHPMDGVTGVRGAAPIWQRFMEIALEDRLVLAWEPPPSVVTLEVDALSGVLPSPYSPETREEYFLAASVPTQRDMVHQPFQIHVGTGLLATPDTPPEESVERVFVVLPKEAEAWQRQQPAGSAFRLPPEEFVASAAPVASAAGTAVIVQPSESRPVRSLLEIVGTAAGPDFAGYEVHYGAGSAPGDWIRIGSPSSQPISEGVLAGMDTIQLVDGVYTLRLTVRATSGLEEIVFRRFTVDNTPPTARLVGPLDGARIPLGSLQLVVQVEDAGGVAQVEYFIDGGSVGDSKRAPFDLAWTSTPGQHVLVARVVDRAGNRAETDPIRFLVG
jgi:membrane carboxypeptidase/penicillin-binding protein PbpC